MIYVYVTIIFIHLKQTYNLSSFPRTAIWLLVMMTSSKNRKCIYQKKQANNTCVLLLVPQNPICPQIIRSDVALSSSRVVALCCCRRLRALFFFFSSSSPSTIVSLSLSLSLAAIEMGHFRARAPLPPNYTRTLRQRDGTLCMSTLERPRQERAGL